MTLRLYVPIDAAALAVGAEEVASALHAAAARHNVAVNIVRNGSRGLYWLEPMVEVETTAPGASRTHGMTTVDVLPERGGPMISTAVSGPA